MPVRKSSRRSRPIRLRGARRFRPAARGGGRAARAPVADGRRAATGGCRLRGRSPPAGGRGGRRPESRAGTAPRTAAQATPRAAPTGAPREQPVGTTQLQVSWEPGRVVAWAGGARRTDRRRREGSARRCSPRRARRNRAGPAHAAVPLPGGAQADALAIPVGEVLGWLVAAGAGQVGDDVGASVRWLGRVAIWAVELTARGAMVPLLRQRTRAERAPTRVERFVLGALDAGARRRAAARARVANACRAACSRSTATSTPRAHPLRAHRHGRRDLPRRRAPARGAGAAAARAHRDRRRRGVPRAGSTAARSTRRCDVAGEIVGADRALGLARSPSEHAAPDRAARSARRRRRVAPRGASRRDRGRARPDRAGDRDGRSGPSRTSKTRSRASNACCPRCCARAARGAARSILSQDEAWELMTTTGPQLARRRLRRARARSCRGASRRRRCACSSTPRRRSTVGANQLANVRWSAVFDDVELTAADIARLAKEARPLIRSGGRWVAIDQADLAGRGRGARRTGQHDAAVRRRDAAPRARPRRLAARAAASPSSVAVGPPTCSRPRPNVVGRPGRRARRLRRRAAQLPGRSARVARLPRHGRARRLPRARHGSRQDADDARPPARRRGRGPGARDRAARGRRQLDGGGRALHARACASSCTTARTAPRADEIAAEVADADVVVTTYGTAVRDVDAHRRRSRGRASCSTRRRRSRTPPTTRRSSCAASPRARRIALTGTPIENGLGDLWAILDFTNPGLVGPRPQFIAAAVERRHAPRASRPKTRCARSTASSCSGARRPSPTIAAELPDQIDELDHCAMTPEQIGLYQAVLDTLVTGTDARRGREAAQGPDPRRDHRAQADLQPPGGVPGRRPAARGPFGQARAARGDRRRGVRGRRDACSCSRTSREWGMRLAEHLTEAHRHAGRVLPRRPVAHGARPASSTTSRAAKARARSCCR